ncbi:hypothetical protein B0H13DRAFT_2374645 [Mycena leptocephala]|nr:hypothetical protein B0H13DRAFT_2374645 [Mycena leptocephala]
MADGTGTAPVARVPSNHRHGHGRQPYTRPPRTCFIPRPLHPRTMHRDLRLENLQQLPLPIRAIASAACSASRSQQDIASFIARMRFGGIPPDHKTLLLPALYALLDPTGIPTMEQLDNPSLFTITTIDQAVDILEVLYQISVPRHLGPEIWSRVWKWTDFISKFRHNLPGQFLDEASCCVGFLSFSENFVCDKFMLSTPGFRSMVVRAWSFVLHDQTKDQKFAFGRVLCFVASINSSNLASFEEIIEGAGGSLHHLSEMAVRSIDLILHTRKFPVDDMTVGSLAVIIDFLLLAERCDWKRSRVQRNPVLDPKEGRGWLSDLYLALPDCKIVDSITRAACALVESTDDRSADTVQKCLSIVGLLLHEHGHRGLETAVAAGFLRVPVWYAQLRHRPDMPGTLETLFTLISSFLIYYGVVSKEFTSLAQERIGVFKALVKERSGSRKACDNIECGIIGPKTEFRVDWRTGGHREFCSPYNSLILSERQPLTLREREFIRAVVHHDYVAAKLEIYVDQCASMRTYPDCAVQTTFEYSTGPVNICVEDTDQDFVDTHDEWLDSIQRAERSVGRMALHVVQLKIGKFFRSILVPLRKNNSDTEELLKRIADSEDDLASDTVAAEIRAHLEHGEKDLVEIH